MLYGSVMLLIVALRRTQPSKGASIVSNPANKNIIVLHYSISKGYYCFIAVREEVRNYADLHIGVMTNRRLRPKGTYLPL